MPPPVSLTVLYVLPATGVQPVVTVEYEAHRKVLITALPATLEPYVNVNVNATVLSLLRSPDIVGEVYRPFRNQASVDQTPEQYNTMVRESIIGDRYTVEWDEPTGLVTIGFRHGAPGDAEAFIDALIGRIETRLGEQMAGRFRDAETSIQTSLERTEGSIARLIMQTAERAGLGSDATTIVAEIDSSGSEMLSSLAQTLYAKEELERIAGDPASLLNPVGETTVFEQTTTSRSMIVIITTITALFLAIFLAFVLEYVRRVREEPEEMAKLSSAWHRR